MSSEDFSMSRYIVGTPTDSVGSSTTSKDQVTSAPPIAPGPDGRSSFSITPMSFSMDTVANESLSNDAVRFQLPSFLLGAPTPAAGGGGEAFPGSFSNLGDFGNWLGGSGSSFHDSGDLFTKGYSPDALTPPTIDRPSQRNGPLDYGSGNSNAPSPITPPTDAVPPQTIPLLANPSFEPDSFRSLPLSSTSQITGSKAPPLYSTTGFDMLGILARVASRPNPTIVLGPVDLSCSFVVVDVLRYDHPIIYASPTFFKLTGYEATEVIGRNCRFLQAPDGVVERGSPRSFTDQTAVAHIKKCLGANKECQANLMNYRKGGVPFLNLVSIIPISGDDPDEIQFHVGFQVDLVHQPNAILQTMRDGTYLVNYSNMAAPTAGLHPRRLLGDGKRGEIPGALSAALRDLTAGILPGGAAELAKKTDEQNKSDFNTLLLENADDLVHVLSVKGVLQYASPSLLHHLEYTADEIIGMTIADIAHPQDLTPITRELKEASCLVETPTNANIVAQKTVHLLYRVRRKRSGMVWLEASGRLHMEPGKTRKSIIFSGRLRNVPSLTWRKVERMGGLGCDSALGSPSEFWARLSALTGLFIFVERRVDEILGHDRDELMGSSILNLVDGDDRDKVTDAMIRAFSGGDNIPVTIGATLLSRRDNVRKPTDIIFYPPDVRQPTRSFCSSAGTELCPAGPSSLLAQIRIKPATTIVNTNKRPWRTTGHAASSSIYDELDVARGTNWNYEVETIRQNNDKLRAEIVALSPDAADDVASRRKRQLMSRLSPD
ncbi:blue light receptor [Tulasnella sp. 330]|nr:blue light receptor [Tulasnella sp. 330]KAG8869958.1 blue light receptor [Tulasnella sp. 331]KAG8873990.1 blue light receptor [Tulasnella sp. 332]